MREVFHKSYGPRGTAPIPLPGIRSRDFEYAIFNAISEHTSRDGESRVDLTPRAADRGQDIVITGLSQSRLLGFEFEEGTRKIVIECKLTAQARLPLDHVASSVLQRRGDCQAYILITNSSLTPRSLAYLQRDCDDRNIDFRLIDAHNFDLHLAQMASASPLSPTSLQVSYQVLNNIHPDGHGCRVYVVVRPFSAGDHEVTVTLHSTRAWRNVGEQPKKRMFSGDGLAAFEILLKPRGARLSRSAKLALSYQGSRRLIEVSLAQSEIPVDLPVFGDMSEKVLSFWGKIRTATNPGILLLHSPSGTGKSRFMAEIARRMGYENLKWIVMRDDGTAYQNPSFSLPPSPNKMKVVTQSRFITAISETPKHDVNQNLILIDDLHLASPDTLAGLEAAIFSRPLECYLVLAGRSDPAIRRARYEAFAHLLIDNSTGGAPNGIQIEYLQFGRLMPQEISNFLSTLIVGESLNVSQGLLNEGALRPIEVVQFVHSLLERKFLYWSDENRLAVNPEYQDTLKDGGAAPRIATEILESRLSFLADLRILDFTALDLFVLIALADRPDLTLKVLDDENVDDEVTRYWFRKSPSGDAAFFTHDFVFEGLTSRGFNFGAGLNLRRALKAFPMLEDGLSDAELVAVYLHERDFDKPVRALASTANSLREVRNISTLSLDDAKYNELASLLYFLSSSSRRLPGIFRRALIARCYLNVHHRDFVAGLVDCLGLLGKADRGRENSSRLNQVAIRQLLAHGLLNSGDARTALSLMHEVENALIAMEKSRFASAVAFDMCDRLQAYYTRQSAFELARTFLLRGRREAHRSHDQRLVNLSLSAEFHLYRYLDGHEGLRLAERQVRHAKMHATPRARIHAELNRLCAEWLLGEEPTAKKYTAELKEMLSTSQEKGFGHLVPRINYAMAVEAYLSLPMTGDMEMLEDRLEKTRRSGFRYGYGEYLWLADNLNLLLLVRQGAPDDEIVSQAFKVIQALARDGLTFIGGDYLCFQNVVVLSNALRAIYVFADENSAWKAGENIQFSPLICSNRRDKEGCLERVFSGGLLVRKFDESTLYRDQDGFYVILV